MIKKKTGQCNLKVNEGKDAVDFWRAPMFLRRALGNHEPDESFSLSPRERVGVRGQAFESPMAPTLTHGSRKRE